MIANIFNVWLRKIVLMVILYVSLSLVVGCAEDPPHNSVEQDLNNGMPSYEEVMLKGKPFKMELALTPEQRAQGLMGRESMADDEGMLFVYPDRDPYPKELRFWMKDCLIPIDVIFINRDGEITAIHEMLPPPPGTPDKDLPSYSSDGPVQFAIEIRGGLARELGLQVGDVIELHTEYLMDLAE